MLPDRRTLVGALDEWLHLTTFPHDDVPLRCGVSGGADSLALLALGVAAGCPITAVHVDHGQRDGGPDEAAFVERCAVEIGAEFESVRVEVEAGPNLEARLRSARRNVLGPHAATGHTADDQAETLLINLVRGAGLVGMGAMTPGSTTPILGLRRADTEAVCATMGWVPFSDPTNSDLAFVRNRIRHEVLPLLSDIADRDVIPLLARATAHARAAASLIADRADELDPRDARALAAADPAVAASAIQRWVIAETGAEHPIDSGAISRILAVANGQVLAAEVVGGWRVSRSHQRLSIS